jgi:hypothetical protein
VVGIAILLNTGFYITSQPEFKDASDFTNEFNSFHEQSYIARDSYMFY